MTPSARSQPLSLARTLRQMSPQPIARTCPHHERVAAATAVRHAWLRTKTRRQRRYMCKECGRTFTATAGTPYHRLRHRSELFDRVIAMSTEGMSKSGIARVAGISPQTVTRWIERGAAHATRFRDKAIRNVEPVEVQVDELRTFVGGKDQTSWIYTSIEVWSRLWLSARIGRRTVRNTRVHYREVQDRCVAVGEPALLTSDGFIYNERAARRVLGPRWVYVQIEKFRTGKRGVRTKQRLVLGNEWRLDAARDRSEDSRKFNTSYVERLNLTLRSSIAALHRKTMAWARTEERLRESVATLQCVYNFVRRHSSLPGKVTPAMQAGLANRPLTLRDIFLARSQLKWSWAGSRQIGRKPPRGSHS